MAIHISAEYHDGIASTAFYPKKNPVKLATGPAGALGGGGWSIDTWATVVQISVKKSDNTWESQVAAPLGGNIPQSTTILTTTTSAQGQWVNSTTLYSIFIEFYKKVSGVYTLDFTETKAAGSTKTTKTTYVGGDQVRFRCRYTDSGIDGDWSDYASAIIPS